MHDDVPQIQAALNCNPPELAVAALSAGNTIDILRMSCSASQAASYPAAFLEFGSGVVARRDNLSFNSGPLRPSNPFPATSVLRI